MKIGILGNTPGRYFDQFKSLEGAGHQVSFVAWDQLAATSGSTESVSVSGTDQTFDLVLVRGMPRGSLEQIIFRMNVLARWQACGMRIVNSPRSLEIAIDKYLTLAKLSAAGIPVPATCVSQTVQAALNDFERLGKDVVVKPVFGGEGKGIVRISDIEIAHRVFRTIVNFQGVVYQQAFIESGGVDLRVLIAGPRVWGMSRHNTLDWRTNASRGANCKLLDIDPATLELATRAVEVAGTEVAGVDIILGKDGQPVVLEVNGVPGWLEIEKLHGVNVAKEIIDWLENGK